MTSEPGIDYPIGATAAEWAPMQMSLDMLDEAVEATYDINRPGIYRYDHFLIYNQVPWATTDSNMNIKQLLILFLVLLAGTSLFAEEDFNRETPAPGTSDSPGFTAAYPPRPTPT